MKKYLLFFSIIAFMLTAGCSIMPAKIKEPQGYPYEPPRVIQSQPKADSNKLVLDAINNMGDRIVAAINQEQQATEPVNGKKKPPANLFKDEKEKPATKKVQVSSKYENKKLKLQVAVNTKRINDLNKTAENHGKEILLAQCQENDCAIDDVGLFPAGVTELQCSKKGCNLEKQIETMIVEREKEGYVPFLVTGYTDDDGAASNQDTSLKRAESVKTKMVVLRHCYKDLETKGGGPTRMFGTINESGQNPNRRVRIYWSRDEDGI